MAELKDTNCRQSEKLDLIVDKLSEERGGWRTLMALGGAAGCDSRAGLMARSPSGLVTPKPRCVTISE